MHFRKLARNSKNGSSYSETDENLGLGRVYTMNVDIFAVERVKVIWGHSVHFSESWAVSQIRLIVERNG